MNKEYEQYQKDRIARLEQEAAEHNAQLLPEHEGYIRMDGPRRQYRAEVRGGVLYYTEI